MVGSQLLFNVSKQVSLLQQAQEQVKDLTEQLIETTGIDVVVVIDTTASWHETQPQVHDTLMFLFDLLRKVSAESRVAIVGYRLDVVAHRALRPIRSEQSVERIGRWLSELKPETSHSDIRKGVDTGLGSFEEPTGAKRREVLVIIGDVGTGEIDGVAGLCDMERAEASLLEQRCRSWLSRSTERRVVSLYTGAAGTVDQSFYRRIGTHMTGEQGTFTDNPAEMLKTVLEATLAR